MPTLERRGHRPIEREGQANDTLCPLPQSPHHSLSTPAPQNPSSVASTIHFRPNTKSSLKVTAARFLPFPKWRPAGFDRRRWARPRVVNPGSGSTACGLLGPPIAREPHLRSQRHYSPGGRIQHWVSYLGRVLLLK